MNKKIDKIKNLRLFLLKQMEGLTANQLNDVPDGINNNIIWNMAHLTSVQQNLCYVRAGLPVVIEEKYFRTYLSGTRPEIFVDDAEIKKIKEMLITSIDRMQADFEKNLFENYTPSAAIQKEYGIEVNNIDEAIDYLLYHEGFHTGYMLSLKHLL